MGGRVGERILSWQTLLTLCGCDFIQTQTQENKLLAPPGLHILTHTLNTYTWYLQTNEEIGAITLIKKKKWVLVF